MLDQTQKDALGLWYAQPRVLKEAQELIDGQQWEELEELIQMRALLPLGRHDQLPPYLRTEDGGPLIPGNVDPRRDIEEWRDAVEVGWAVIESKLGLSLDQVHIAIKEQQDRDWAAFMESVEQRRRERKKG